jgi:hypothetical protein
MTLLPTHVPMADWQRPRMLLMARCSEGDACEAQQQQQQQQQQ